MPVRPGSPPRAVRVTVHQRLGGRPYLRYHQRLGGRPPPPGQCRPRFCSVPSATRRGSHEEKRRTESCIRISLSEFIDPDQSQRFDQSGRNEIWWEPFPLARTCDTGATNFKVGPPPPCYPCGPHGWKKETVACTQEGRRKEPEKPIGERKEQEDRSTQRVCGPDQVLAPIPRWQRIRVEWSYREGVG